MLFVPGLAEVVILLTTACVFFCMYVTRNRNFWKEQKIIHEKFSLVIGPTRRLLSKPVCLTDQERCQKMGRLFGIYEGGKPTLVVAEPHLVKQVLVKDFHLFPNRRMRRTGDPILDNMMVLAPVEIWRRVRPAASPAFSTGKLRKMNALIQDCARITCKHLKAAAEEERDVDMKQFYGHYSLDMIARCAFGTKLDSHTDATNEFVTQARSAFSSKISLRMIIAVLFPGLMKYFRLVRRGSVFEYFKKVCQRIIADRRQNGQVSIHAINAPSPLVRVVKWSVTPAQGTVSGKTGWNGNDGDEMPLQVGGKRKDRLPTPMRKQENMTTETDIAYNTTGPACEERARNVVQRAFKAE